jgi:hypothetical protein
MQGLIDRADSDKLKKARERLKQAAGPEGLRNNPRNILIVFPVRGFLDK